MNPGENNPLNNTGASATPGSAPLDFTTPAADTNADAGLSMADSVSMAQDNLTSAGMAAPDTNNNAVGLDQISSIDPTATMAAASDQPLVPAAPVPGSIGSVTSVPPLNPTPEVTDPTTPAETTPTPASTNPFANKPAATIAEGAGGVGSALPTDKPDIAATEPAQPYNPFATQPGAMPASSSTDIPDALQPPVEKFSDGGAKPKTNLLTLALGGLAVLFAVTTIIFLVLWIQAKDSAGSGNPIVISPIDDDPVGDTLSLLSCSRDDDAAAASAVFPEVQAVSHLVTANFKNDNLSSIELANGYSFATVEAAEAMRGYFEAEMANFVTIGEQLGIEPITAEFTIDGFTISEKMVSSEEKLMGDYLNVFMLPAAADGGVHGFIDAVVDNYEANGFICQVD